jgi:hypothetical protein
MHQDQVTCGLGAADVIRREIKELEDRFQAMIDNEFQHLDQLLGQNLL